MPVGQLSGGRTPSYRGLAYVTFRGGEMNGQSWGIDDGFEWGVSGNIPNIEFEVTRIPRDLTDNGTAVVNGHDANPIHVLYDALTNDEWGLNLGDDEIDMVQLRLDAGRLFQEGQGFSYLADQAMEVQDLIDMLADQCDMAVFQNGGVARTLLRREIPDPNTLTQIEPEDINPDRGRTKLSTSSVADTPTDVSIEFFSRQLDYNKTTATGHDLAVFFSQQSTQNTVSLRMPGVREEAQANRIAARVLRYLTKPLRRGTYVVDRKFDRVVPGQAVAITDPAFDLDQVVFRVSRGELRHGTRCAD